MGKPLRLTADLVCAVCGQAIHPNATFVCSASGERVTSFHASCHRSLLATPAPLPDAE
jgi:predicted nucleic acid-binding Zn ribbon protein